MALVYLLTERRPPTATLRLFEDLQQDLETFLGADPRGGPVFTYDASDSPT